MIEKGKHDVFVEAYTQSKYENWATVDVAMFPDGSPMNSLDAGELREVAKMIEEVADEMEEHD